ncbi:protein WHAT'S THIS FACTOR 9, mitochondrial [Typha latifolia]|uniref:protein WHAT'S THIS FACTOR 9, mitochondrial n=1 Tax=Typha latifolia TaxID=4733 RepID=UPI003C2F6424
MKKVRLKWVKNRGLDHIIDRDTDVKACCLLLETISRCPTGLVPARSLSPLQKTLGLTVPVLRFLRRYPTLFQECPHPRFPTLPSFSLSSPASLLLSRLSSAAASSSSHLNLARLLMLSKSKSLPLTAIYPLRFDLGLPPDFARAFPASHPDLFLLSRRNSDGAPVVSLASQPDHLVISALQRKRLSDDNSISYRDLKKPPSSSAAPLAFPMRFPRGYGSMNKVKAWMEEFHRLPYISPYDDPSGIDPESDLMEKRVVGVLHELLSLTVHKKTKRNYIRALREELALPHKFTRVFTRYPGVFYLSLKCKTTTVVLREGYERGKLVEPHPVASLREKVHYVMRTGLIYRGKGLTKLVLDEEEEEDAIHGDDDDDVESYELDISEGEEESEEEDDEEED